MQQVNRSETELCDHDLARAARAGSEPALVTLFDRYYNDVLYYLLSQTQDRDQALDLAQDTFLDVVRSQKKIPEDRPFRAWLFVVARNNLLNDLRRRRIRRAISLDWLRGSGADVASTADDGGIPAVLLDDTALQEVLAGLSVTLREPLVLLGIERARQQQESTQSRSPARRVHRWQVALVTILLLIPIFALLGPEASWANFPLGRSIGIYEAVDRVQYRAFPDVPVPTATVIPPLRVGR